MKKFFYTLALFALLRADSSASRRLGPPAPLPAAAEPGDLARLVAPPGWMNDLDRAMKIALAEYRPVLVLFTSPGCQWCQRLKTDTLAHEEIRALLNEFILVEVDVSENPGPARVYQVRGVPTIIVMSSDGRVRAGVGGFAGVPELKDMIQQVLNPAFVRKTGAEHRELLNMLASGVLPAEKWPEIMLAMGQTGARKEIRERISGLNPFPMRQMADLLKDERLAVRLGALEILEERLGDTFGFDAWLDPGNETGNEEALARMLEAAGDRDETGLRYSALTADQLGKYIHDLVSDNRERSARAMRMLEQGGADMAVHLSEFLADSGDLPEGARNRVREVQYSIMAPKVSGMDPSVFAHRLVFGTLDARLQCISALRSTGRRGAAILADFLEDPNPIVRETTADVLSSIGGKAVVNMLKERLARERDDEVVFAIIKSLGKIRSQTGLAVLKSYLASDNEDLAIAAINSISRLKTKLAADELGRCLEDPRWRVRASALDAVAALKIAQLKDKVLARLDDSDAFVRYAAVKCAAQVAEDKKEAAQKLEELFLREDDMKGAIVETLGSLDAPLPASFAAALDGKSPEIVLSVIGGLDGCGDSGLELAARFANHANSDVACAALRLLGARGMKTARHRAILTDALKSGRRERILAALVPQAETWDSDEISPFVVEFSFGAGAAQTAPDPTFDMEALMGAFDGADAKPAPAPGAAAPAAFDLDALVDSFGGGGTAAPAGGDWRSLLDAVRSLLESSDDEEIEFAAALRLARAGDAASVPYLSTAVGTATANQRVAVAEALEAVDNDKTLSLLSFLLDDPSSAVRLAAVGAMSKRSQKSAVYMEELLKELLRENTRLKPNELLGDYRFRQALAEKFSAKKIAREYALKMLDAGRDNVSRNMGLVILAKTWRPGDEKTVEPFMEAADPFQRRAAYYALGANDKAAFAKRLDAVAADASEHVRMVLPAIHTAASTTWINYLDQAMFEIDYQSYQMSSRERGIAPLDPRVRTALESLARDESPRVRFEAFMCLLSNRVSVDLNEFIEAIDAFPDRAAVSERVAGYLVERHSELGESFKALLPYLDAGGYGDETLARVRKHFGRESEDDEEDSHYVYRKTLGGSAPAVFLDPPPAAPAGVPRVKIALFTSAGCSDCARVDALLRELLEDSDEIEIERHDIRKVDAMRLNEALSDRFNVPQKTRLVAPTVFAAAGYLVGKEITFSRLGDLVYRSSLIPSDAWRDMGENDMRRAEAAIGGRYSAMGMGVVAVAGLLDGVNPCAFATIVFLLSYLRLARRTPHEILRIGGAFILAVFIAYFAMGLGIAEALAGIRALRHAAKITTWTMGALALAIMALSIRDGFLCLKGEAEAMALQLPGFLKTRIHGVIRRGAKHSRFVAAAFVAGVAISFLEMACTGQVYAPTILFMLKTGGDTAGAVSYLAVYNIAFILPLLVVFGFAYGGLRSETLAGIMRKHAAAVKFCTAALFLALFTLLIFGDRILAASH